MVSDQEWQQKADVKFLTDAVQKVVKYLAHN
mgnify:FL=1